MPITPVDLNGSRVNDVVETYLNQDQSRRTFLRGLAVRSALIAPVVATFTIAQTHRSGARVIAVNAVGGSNTGGVATMTAPSSVVAGDSPLRATLTVTAATTGGSNTGGSNNRREQHRREQHRSEQYRSG